MWQHPQPTNTLKPSPPAQLEASPLRRLELEVDEVEFTARDVTGTLRVAFTSAGMQVRHIGGSGGALGVPRLLRARKCTIGWKTAAATRLRLPALAGPHPQAVGDGVVGGAPAWAAGCAARGQGTAA